MPEKKQTMPDFSIERGLLDEGYKIIAGIDEAGRGSLAGPLSVGMTIYNPEIILNPPEEITLLINDSKKLSHIKRINALKIIETYSKHAAVKFINHRIIDRINVNRATELAVKKLIEDSPVRPDIIIMDGRTAFNTGIKMNTYIKGDGRSITIASASIAAKVRRDFLLEKFESIYPLYNFKRNKGYGTAEHIALIMEHGCSAIHRKSYEPVKSLLNEKKPI
jgi:ribonuclease HII